MRCHCQQLARPRTRWCCLAAAAAPQRARRHQSQRRQIRPQGRGRRERHLQPVNAQARWRVKDQSNRQEIRREKRHTGKPEDLPVGNPSSFVVVGESGVDRLGLSAVRKTLSLSLLCGLASLANASLLLPSLLSLTGAAVVVPANFACGEHHVTLDHSHRTPSRHLRPPGAILSLIFAPPSCLPTLFLSSFPPRQTWTQLL